MAKEDAADLLRFLDSFPTAMQQTVLWLRDFVWDRYPTANELIYDNYNALAFGWSPTDRLGHTFCSVAAYRTGTNIHFGFYWGNELADPEKLLLGQGNQYRYIQVKNIEDFPAEQMEALIKEAYANSLAKVKDNKQLMEGKTFTKSISGAKRPKTKQK